MVAGEPAFGGADLGQLLNDILRGTPAPVAQLRAGVPPALDDVIGRAMQKNRLQPLPGRRRDGARPRAGPHRAPSRARRLAPGPDAAADPYAATLAGTMTQTLVQPAAAGFALAPEFDSSAGLARLEQGDPHAATTARARRSTRWVGWLFAYGLAAAGALAIAWP